MKLLWVLINAPSEELYKSYGSLILILDIK